MYLDFAASAATYIQTLAIHTLDRAASSSSCNLLLHHLSLPLPLSPLSPVSPSSRNLHRVPCLSFCALLQNPGYCEQEPPITRAPPSLPPPPRCAHTLPLNILLPTSYQSRQPKAGLVDKTLCYNFDEPSAASDHLTLCWIIAECCATCFEGSVCALYAHCESMNPGPASQPIYLLFSGSNYDAFARPT